MELSIFYANHLSCSRFMKRAIVERNIVVVLFVLVLVLFSFAERDSKKLKQLYTVAATAVQKLASATSSAQD
jgi:hypothetical protein